MGSDLGYGFIVMLLSCDLYMMQPLLIGQIVPPQGYLHFLGNLYVQRTKIGGNFLKSRLNENQKLLIG